MESNIIKVRKEELINLTLNGNFLYEENGELYFTNKLNHTIFELDKDFKNYDETLNHSMNFEDYIQKFMEICSEVKNKPSLLFLNCVPKNIIKILNGTEDNYKHNYHFLTELNQDEDFKNFNEKPCVTCVQEGFADVLKKLVETRNDDISQNDVFVFFDEPENIHNLRLPSLDTVITISRSRRIYFVLNFINKSKYIEKYGPESYQVIEDNCKTKFICDYNGVVDIQP